MQTICCRNRLAALYSDFRHLRTTNTDGYTANIEAWQKGLANAAKGGHIPNRGAAGDLLILNIDENLLCALETKEWGRPLALGAVIREAVSKKEMVPAQEFLSAQTSIYHKSWALKPWELLSWGLRQLGLAGGQDGEDKLPIGRLAILANIESAANELNQRVTGLTRRTDRIYSKKLFQEAFANTLGGKNQMTTADMDVLLKFMARDKGMLAYDGQTIKLRGPTDAETLSITSEDSTIASLKTLIDDLQAQVDGLSVRVEKLASTGRDAIARKNRISALAALRAKKLIETNLSRQSATLLQLEEVYAKIGQAADQVELVRILEGSTGVLKSLNAEMGGAERVEDVVHELNEQMAQVEEFGKALTEVGQGTDNQDEVDAELEAMEREEREKKRAEAELLEKEERECVQIAETKRKLERLEVAERQAAKGRMEAAQGTSHTEQSLDETIDDTIAELRHISLEGQRSAETAL
jgi:charged multivesicular body protein 7